MTTVNVAAISISPGHEAQWLIDKANDLAHRYHQINEVYSPRTLNLVRTTANITKKRYTEDISIQQISDDLNITPNYLSKIFKKVYGIKFTDYLLQIRMEKAYELLQDPSISIKQVSEVTGFNDPNYFTRQFKKYFRIKPSSLNKQFKDGTIL